MRDLGPRQLELIDYIRENGGRVSVVRGLHPNYFVKLTDPPRLVTADRVLSLVDRGVLRRVADGGYDYHYELTAR